MSTKRNNHRRCPGQVATSCCPLHHKCIRHTPPLQANRWCASGGCSDGESNWLLIVACSKTGRYRHSSKQARGLGQVKSKESRPDLKVNGGLVGVQRCWERWLIAIIIACTHAWTLSANAELSSRASYAGGEVASPLPHAPRNSAQDTTVGVLDQHGCSTCLST